MVSYLRRDCRDAVETIELVAYVLGGWTWSMLSTW
jgi:hypothetical protein